VLTPSDPAATLSAEIKILALHQRAIEISQVHCSLCWSCDRSFLDSHCVCLASSQIKLCTNMLIGDVRGCAMYLTSTNKAYCDETVSDRIRDASEARLT
jgi:hypothetical protein